MGGGEKVGTGPFSRWAFRWMLQWIIQMPIESGPRNVYRLHRCEADHVGILARSLQDVVVEPN